MAAQVEEIVVHSHPVEPEDVRPNRSQELFHLILGARRPVRGLASQTGGGRARRSTFPWGVSGKASMATKKKRPGSWSPAGSGPGMSAAPEPGPAPRRTPGTRAGRSPGAGRPGDGHGLPDRRWLQGRLDLTQLDAEAADLHLVVAAAQVVEIPPGRRRARSPVR